MEDKTLQVQQKSSDKAPVMLSSLDTIPNMLPNYRKLVNFYRAAPDDCPTLFVVDDSCMSTPYLKCSDILLIKRGVSLEKSMLINNYRDPLPITSFEDCSYDIYLNP